VGLITVSLGAKQSPFRTSLLTEEQPNVISLDTVTDALFVINNYSFVALDLVNSLEEMIIPYTSTSQNFFLDDRWKEIKYTRFMKFPASAPEGNTIE